MSQRRCCGLIGCGTVGAGVVRLWQEASHAPDARLKAVAVRDPRKRRAVDLSGIRILADPWEMVADPEVSVVIEATGDTALAHAIAAECLRRRRAFVTADKALVAHHGRELEDLARAQRVAFLYEAAVGGVLPVVSLLRLGLSPGRVRGLEGVLNGTCNFIVSRLGEGLSFSASLDAARRAGFAEPDPRRDVSGQDTAEKLVILGRLCGVDIAPDAVPMEGIEGLRPEDVVFGRGRGWSLRLLGGFHDSGQGIRAGVGPTFVDQGSLLAQARDEENVVVLDGGPVGRVGLIGRGAGSLPTACAILADVREALASGVARPKPRLVLGARPGDDPSPVRHYIAVPKRGPDVVSLLGAAGVGLECVASECPSRTQVLTSPAPTGVVRRALAAISEKTHVVVSERELGRGRLEGARAEETLPLDAPSAPAAP